MVRKIGVSAVRRDKVFRILRELKAKLLDIYNGRMKHLILYGSYARGEATASSDIDLLLVLEDYENSWEEEKRIEDVVGELCLKYDVLLVVLPVRARYLGHRDDPFIRNMLRDKVIV
jgi:predicted nucleotidyltransferase